MKPARTPRPAHARSERSPRVAAHAQTNPATAAIDGAWVMLGSLTRYHAMKDPPTASTTPETASVAPKKIREKRYANQQPSSP